ncbi:hypothetical protein Tco_1454204 [Tanacetum coccineum]
MSLLNSSYLLDIELGYDDPLTMLCCSGKWTDGRVEHCSPQQPPQPCGGGAVPVVEPRKHGKVVKKDGPNGCGYCRLWETSIVKVNIRTLFCFS